MYLIFMKIGTRYIDHLVYAVQDLDVASDELEEALGVRPVFGGYHKTIGTKNALINLGEECYLEILAIDKSNLSVASRWMGVDDITQSTMTRWALKSENLNQDQAILQSYNPAMGQTFEGSRLTPSGTQLKWNMILPLAQPIIELAPFMVNWASSSAHPTESLTDVCPLASITFSHPEPHHAQQMFDQLSIGSSIQKSELKIEAHIQGKNGLVILS